MFSAATLDVCADALTVLGIIVAYEAAKWLLTELYRWLRSDSASAPTIPDVDMR